MRNFQKNVFRTALENKGSFIGAVLIIGIGIFIYVAMFDTLKNLQEQIFLYYEESALADVFAQVSGISETDLLRLEEIPGIQKASGKMAEDVRLLGKGQEEIVTVHLMSYREDDIVNKVMLSETEAGAEDLFLGAKMAAVYGYEPGETLQLVYRGKNYRFTYRGTCQAPNYIYSIPPGGAMIPDGEVYDIACIDESRIEEILGKQDCYTELGFLLSSGFTYDDIKGQLREALEIYGLISLCAQSDQASYNMVAGEMSELISVGTILPLIFMSISLFMLYVVLKKMIDRDQRLIGTMKAFGMTDGELMSAYLVEGAAAGALGAAAGSILAVPFGKFMFAMYMDFFVLPDTVYHNYAGSRVTGMVIAVATGILAVFWGVRDILSITPAQAMRSKPPREGAQHQKRFPWMGRAGMLQKMAFRSIVRNPFRCFLIILSIGFPFAMSSVLFSFEGVAEQMFYNQFEKIQVYDLQLSLDSYTHPIRARQGGEVLEGVAESEAVCRLSVEIQKENMTEQTVLYGLNPGSQLWKIMDTQGNYYEPPAKGIIINQRTADTLHVGRGDSILLKSPGITVDSVETVVSEVINESFGSSCYMSMEGIGETFPAGELANTVILKMEKGKKDEVKKQVQNTGKVTWLIDTGKIIKSYRDMMGSMLAMIYMFALLSVAAGGILIYNISMINIRERITEFGTLMIMGMSDSEIWNMLFWEHGFYFAGGIVMGVPGSRAIRFLLETLVMSESYSIEMIVRPWAYAGAFVICLAITIAACLAENQFVRTICLTDILKERE